MVLERSPFLPLPEGMVIGQVEISPTQLTVEVIATQPWACCPACGTLSDSVHCQYQRTVHDVPCGGRKVVLRLRVRKFVCRCASCPRKVFGSTASRVGPALGEGEPSAAGGAQSHWALRLC